MKNADKHTFKYCDVVLSPKNAHVKLYWWCACRSHYWPSDPEHL